jgi:hypothetical protein
MHEIQVPHRSVNKRLEGRGPQPLKDARPQKTGITVARGSRPRRRGDEDGGARDKEVALAPDPARGHADESRHPDPEQEVACQQGNVGEVEAVPDRQGERVGRQDGAQARREDGRQGQDQRDQVTAPERPV